MAEFKEIPLEEITDYKDPFRLFSEWAAATAKGKERTNSLIIGWGGLGILWGKPCCTVYIHESRYSRIIFDEADAFSVSWFPKGQYQESLNYLGGVSGYQEDKMKGCGLSVIEGEAPYFQEAELVLICKKMAESKFELENIRYPERTIDWYRKDGVHTLYYGEIVKVLKKG